MKPDLTFFGDNVDRRIVDEVFERVKDCDSILVIGSSLFVSFPYIVETDHCHLW